jgi:hypothetical protein
MNIFAIDADPVQAARYLRGGGGMSQAEKEARLMRHRFNEQSIRVADLLTAIDRSIDVLDGKTGLMAPFDANLEARRMLNAARKAVAK